jgi:RHS repeat-associated protein
MCDKTMKSTKTVLFLLIMMLIQPLVFAETLNLVYDANGNLITGDGVFRVYNSLNQLWKVYNGSSTSGGLLLQYVYHPVEERVYYKTRYFSGGNETTIYVSENFVRVVNSSGNFDYTYVFHEGQQVAQLLPNRQKQFIHGNNEGSSSVITNSSGQVIERTDYAPFGSIISGGSKTRFDYENKEFDSNLESFDFHFRQYKPEWGLFTQPDTLIQNVYDPQSLNRYMFERGNPFIYVDENGHRLAEFWTERAAAVYNIERGVTLSLNYFTMSLESASKGNLQKNYEYGFKSIDIAVDTISKSTRVLLGGAKNTYIGTDWSLDVAPELGLNYVDNYYEPLYIQQHNELMSLRNLPTGNYRYISFEQSLVYTSKLISLINSNFGYSMESNGVKISPTNGGKSRRSHSNMPNFCQNCNTGYDYNSQGNGYYDYENQISVDTTIDKTK